MGRDAVQRSGGVADGARLRELLGFASDQDVVFVLPTLLAGSPKRQAVAIEDVHAIEALSKALLAGDQQPKPNVEIEFADDLYFLDDLAAVNRHLVSICSTRRNTFTRSVLSHPTTRVRFSCHFSEVTEAGRARKQGRFVSLGRRTYWSLDDNPDNDFALIARVPNPWILTRSVVVVLAGTRGVGTWGAGEYLRRSSAELLEQTNGKDFVAVVEVRLEEGRVIPTLDRVEVFEADGHRGTSKQIGSSAEPSGPAVTGQEGHKPYGDGSLVDRPDPAIWGYDPSVLGGNVYPLVARSANDESLSLEGAMSLDEVVQLLHIKPEDIDALVAANKLLVMDSGEEGSRFPYWQFVVDASGASLFRGTADLIAAFPDDRAKLFRWAERPHVGLSNRSPAAAIAVGDGDKVIALVMVRHAASW